MFHSARLKLTAWYLLSIMLISVVFSLAVYHGSTFEIRRGLYRQALRNTIEREYFERPGMIPSPTRPLPNYPIVRAFPPAPLGFDEDLFAEQQRRVALQLLFFNVGVFGIAGAAGYFLAGRTLKPIEEMVGKQKRFVADASHELRTPLTAMRTETEVALRDTGLDVSSAREVLQSNLEEIGKLQLLAESLLMLGRYEEASYRLNLTHVRVADAFRDASEGVRALAVAKHIEVESDIGEGITLEAGKEQITQLFFIFLDNAIKYSDENGKVIVRAEATKGRVVISVRDFGIGISAAELPYIFNRFYRADTSRTKTGVQGYGLGLSIAKSIIDLHHGTVDVASVPAQGTTFTITLPRKQQNPATRQGGAVS